MAETGGDLHWRISSLSGGSNCVAVAIRRDVVLIRDSKDPSGPSLRFTPSEWIAFLEGVKQGDFD
jgi:hypothetical protein